MLPLFSYGTLRDPELQQALFDRTYETRPAVLHGYVIVSTGGYLSAMQSEGDSICGALVELDEAGYAIADRWEDLDVYVRQAAVAVDQDGNRLPCFLYVRPDQRGEIVVDGRLSDFSREKMLADIRAFRAASSSNTSGLVATICS